MEVYKYQLFNYYKQNNNATSSIAWNNISNLFNEHVTAISIPWKYDTFHKIWSTWTSSQNISIQLKHKKFNDSNYVLGIKAFHNILDNMLDNQIITVLDKIHSPHGILYIFCGIISSDKCDVDILSNKVII